MKLIKHPNVVRLYEVLSLVFRILSESFNCTPIFLNALQKKKVINYAENALIVF
jgi:hypothetical protein